MLRDEHGAAHANEKAGFDGSLRGMSPRPPLLPPPPLRKTRIQPTLREVPMLRISA